MNGEGKHQRVPQQQQQQQQQSPAVEAPPEEEDEDLPELVDLFQMVGMGQVATPEEEHETVVQFRFPGHSHQSIDNALMRLQNDRARVTMFILPDGMTDGMRESVPFSTRGLRK